MAEREVDELIQLNGRIEILLDKYRELQQELGKERSEKKEIEKALAEKDKELEELKKEHNKIKLSGAIRGDDESTQFARKRINKLVREIDNCIALLNNI